MNINLEMYKLCARGDTKDYIWSDWEGSKVGVKDRWKVTHGLTEEETARLV